MAERRKEKRLNESNVSIEVDWWDQCIVEVMQDLEEESGGFLDWTQGTLIKTFNPLGTRVQKPIGGVCRTKVGQSPILVVNPKKCSYLSNNLLFPVILAGIEDIFTAPPVLWVELIFSLGVLLCNKY